MAATWKAYIDWDGDNGHTVLGSFEHTVGTDSWLPGGTVPPTIARSTVRAHHGDASLLVTWGAGGSVPLIGRVDSRLLTVGVSYTYSAWVYVPSGSVDVVCAVSGIGFGGSTAGTDQWKEITQTFTATSSSHQLQVWPASSPAGGEQFWFDEPTIRIAGEDVTTRVLDRSGVTIQYGRDQARSLSPIAPARATLEINNQSRDYSPENASSPLAGNILPARPVVIKGTLASKAYSLLVGHLDDYDVLPNTGEQSVGLSALDALAKFKDVEVTTDLYRGIRTGDAIGLVLDELGWPGDARDLDAGATTIRWYWEEGTDGFAALERLVNSEGPGAFVAISGDGRFMFRDRHHRLLRAASTTSQVTFRDVGTEPLFSAPLVYDHGWRDVLNSVTINVDERDPDGDLSDVFSSDRTYSISDGQTLVVRAQASDPFYAAVTPEADTDYTVLSGAVTVTMSRTEGQSTTLFVKATGGPAVLQGLRVRGRPVRVQRTIQAHAEDSTSIDRYGRRSYTGDAPWAGVEDAKAIADLILARRAERLPIVSMRVVNGNDTRQTQQLARDLSDRITIVDAETGLNDEFYVERIEHRLSQAGKYHETVFGCEKVPTQPTDLFRFDVAGAGFNDGKFAAGGLDDPDTIFLFDSATQGFDDGGFAT